MTPLKFQTLYMYAFTQFGENLGSFLTITINLCDARTSFPADFPLPIWPLFTPKVPESPLERGDWAQFPDLLQSGWKLDNWPKQTRLLHWCNLTSMHFSREEIDQQRNFLSWLSSPLSLSTSTRERTWDTHRDVNTDKHSELFLPVPRKGTINWCLVFG